MRIAITHHLLPHTHYMHMHIHTHAHMSKHAQRHRSEREADHLLSLSLCLCHSNVSCRRSTVAEGGSVRLPERRQSSRAAPASFASHGMHACLPPPLAPHQRSPEPPSLPVASRTVT